MTKATGRNYRMVQMEQALERIAHSALGDWPGYTPHAVAYELGEIAREGLGRPFDSTPKEDDK